jgi:hypothetical protein
VGAELVAYWEGVKANGDTVILGGAEGAAGGGCQTITGSNAFSVDESCETCPCWKIGDPQFGSVDCVEPDPGDGTASGITAGITANIVAGTHCPDALEIRCQPDNCEEPCIWTDNPMFMCPGCRSFDGGDGGGGGGGGGDTEECVCEPKGLGPGTIRNDALEIQKATIPCENPIPGMSCQCCEVKVIVNIPQKCTTAPNPLITKPDMADVLEASIKTKIGQNVPCPECVPERSDPTDVLDCPEEDEKESGWKVLPGGPCPDNCDGADDGSPQTGDTGAVGAGGAAGGGGGNAPGKTSVTTPGGPDGGGGDGMDICDDAVYEMCWKEMFCTSSTIVVISIGPPPGPGDVAVSPGYNPASDIAVGVGGGGGGGGAAFTCKPKVGNTQTVPSSTKATCPDECCSDCSEGEECKGAQAKITYSWECIQGGPTVSIGDDLCGCAFPASVACNTTDNQCPAGDFTLNCYKGCKCTGGDGDNVDEGGPCDDDAGSGPSGRYGDSNSNNSKSSNSSGGTRTRTQNSGGGGGGTTNHEVGGDTREWAGKSNVEFLGEDIPNQEFVKKNRNEESVDIPYSRLLNSEFQVNAKINQKARGVSRKAYGGDFKFNINKGLVISKNRDVISRDIEITSEEFLAASNNSRFTRTTETLRGSRTTNTMYNDNLTLFDSAPTPKKVQFVANSYNLDIFSDRVTKPVYSHLHSVALEDVTWDEAVVQALTLDNIRKSLNPRCLSIGKTLRTNQRYGLNHIDFYKIIREHLLRNTLNELDLAFYETFITKQSKIPRIVVTESEDNEKIAVQMAISYARTAYPADATLGLTNQYSTLYRDKYSDLGSRVAIDRACGEAFIKISPRDTIPVTCKAGTTTMYTLGSLSATPDTLSLVGQGNCDNTLPITQETSHAVRLNNKVRNKILNLLGVDHSEEISAETNKSLEVELNYSLTDKLDEYYFFAAHYPSTEQIDNYNNSDYLVQFSRDYRRVTDIPEIRNIMQDQIGATHYINHDDRMCNHFLKSNTLKYRWVDFTLQGFGLEDVESFPVFVAKNPAYIIVIPSALSENNPYHVFSDLYISGDTVGRRIKLDLHIDARKLQTSIGTDKDAIRVERNDA